MVFTRMPPACARQAAFGSLVLGALLLALAFALLGLAALPQHAFADGGVEVTDVYFCRGDVTDAVSPEPSQSWYISIQFSKNVSYANDGRDDAFVSKNAALVHLVGPDGSEVEGYTVKPGNSRESRQIIYIVTDVWLAPLTTYQVIVDAGVIAANGTDVLAEPYVFKFTTSAQCSNGLSLYENVGIPLIAGLLALGVVVQVVRVRRNAR